MLPYPDPAPVLDPHVLYIGDNGRIFCGAPTCAGSSAAYSGHTISGHAVEVLPAAEVASFLRLVGRLPTCEGCGTPGGGR